MVMVEPISFLIQLSFLSTEACSIASTMTLVMAKDLARDRLTMIEAGTLVQLATTKSMLARKPCMPGTEIDAHMTSCERNSVSRVALSLFNLQQAI